MLDADQPNVVVIDSLSTILIRHGFNKTAQFLNKLRLALKSKQQENTTTENEREKEKEREPGKEKEKEKEGKGSGKGEGGEETNEGSEGGSSILGFVHLDFHQKSSSLLVKNVEYLADTVMKMNTASVSPSLTDSGVAAVWPVGDERRCDILNKRLSGRVSREVSFLFNPPF